MKIPRNWSSNGQDSVSFLRSKKIAFLAVLKKLQIFERENRAEPFQNGQLEKNTTRKMKR